MKEVELTDKWRCAQESACDVLTIINAAYHVCANKFEPKESESNIVNRLSKSSALTTMFMQRDSILHSIKLLRNELEEINDDMISAFKELYLKKGE